MIGFESALQPREQLRRNVGRDRLDPFVSQPACAFDRVDGPNAGVKSSLPNHLNIAAWPASEVVEIESIQSTRERTLNQIAGRLIQW